MNLKDVIKTPPASREYRENFDAIFAERQIPVSTCFPSDFEWSAIDPHTYFKTNTILIKTIDGDITI